MGYNEQKGKIVTTQHGSVAYFFTQYDCFFDLVKNVHVNSNGRSRRLSPLCPVGFFLLYFWRNLAQNCRYATIVCTAGSGFD